MIAINSKEARGLAEARSIQQAETRVTSMRTTQGEDELPAWAMSLQAAPAAPATPVGGGLRPNPAQPAVQSKPKA
eukprot:3006835-Amphidinium_carterae.1